jgi:hypothetical protein
MDRVQNPNFLMVFWYISFVIFIDFMRLFHTEWHSTIHKYIFQTNHHFDKFFIIFNLKESK